MIDGWEHFVIAICICYIFYYLINKSKKAKAQNERMNRPIDQLEDWDDYLAKCCRVSGKNAHEIMTIAAIEAGLSGDKKKISKDFREFIRTGEVPQYTIRFLKKGKECLDEINDEPMKANDTFPWLP